jgi:hypothetical protein
LAPDLHEAVERVPFLAMLRQSFPKVTQAGGIEARIIERQMERNLPAQIKQDPLGRFLVGHIVVELEQERPTHQGRWQTGPTVGRIIECLEIVILEQKVTDGRHAAVERIRGHAMR